MGKYSDRTCEECGKEFSEGDFVVVNETTMGTLVEGELVEPDIISSNIQHSECPK